MYRAILIPFFIFFVCTGQAQTVHRKNTAIINAGAGWAGNSVNTVVFRKNSLISNDSLQFISYYDADGYVIIGKRKWSDTAWQLVRTLYKGNVTDAHNSISLMLDGDGYLHMAWDHHNSPLRYCMSKEPLSAELSEVKPMTGNQEEKITYPEFYKLPGGDLLFFYRDGGSGNGNLIINKYSVKWRKWVRLHSNLIDGEGKRNAYWQACVDMKGYIHISWVWRESPDVASNHDMCYAVSKDGGLSWQKSTGEKYDLPVRAVTAEVVCVIPQNSGLINQTSMCTDESGNPFIATYRNDKNDVPQHHIIFKKDSSSKEKHLVFRKTSFNIGGKGTKQIPISRPQIVCRSKGRKTRIALIFRDAERGDRISVASARNIVRDKWKIKDLSSTSTGSWEPTYDTERWMRSRILSLFMQQTVQADSEGVTRTVPQLVKVLEFKLW
ncbi:MAG: BNR repeat-containing protein [Chitinophagaceae bacterium]|nr:BNR repeat-containing protein [Chitinophagaceae bacterium]